MERERVNKDITYPEVRLLLEDGSQFGLTSSQEALKMAQEKGLDLLEISATAKPPVVRIVDYSKYRYERAKKAKEVRKKQTQNQAVIKELKYRPNILEHDYAVKLKQIKKFIADGDKVKISVRYKGREFAFQSRGMALINRIVADAAEIAVVEQKPEVFGRQQIMVISPKPVEKK